MRIIRLCCAVIILSCSVVAQLPDAPSTVQPPKPRTWMEYKGHKAGFLTVRRFDEPALRTAKEQVLSKSFLAIEGSMWAAGIADMKVNGCRANAPCGTELYVDALVPLAVVSLEHFLLSRWIGALPAAAGPGMAIGIHTKGLLTGIWP